MSRFQKETALAHRQLRRSLGFWALTAYGVGDILGAGIYALVGKIAGLAGAYSWLSFLIALLIAAFTALSYAELGSRFPRSGGESYYFQQAFSWPSLATLMGWIVFCSGVFSLSTVSRAFAGYVLGPWQGASFWVESAVLIVFLLGLALINFWGIRLSSATNIVCTFVEASGLMLVIVVAARFLLREDGPVAIAEQAVITDHAVGGLAVVQGAALAFYAFIGFEDMGKVAEEVKSPERNLPLAIIAALVIAGSVYLLVIWLSTAVVPPDQLAESSAPLLEVVHRAAPGIPPWSFTLIALFAVANTGLLNFVMASRLVYGMAQQGLLPGWLGSVHGRTRTPHRAILSVLAVALVLGLSGTMQFLAQTTSVLLLVAFIGVNVALVAIKQSSQPSPSVFQTRLPIPIVGAVLSLALLMFVPYESLLLASSIIGLGYVVIFVRQRRHTP